jgi:putative SOS response-associated peptidase YedK
MAVYPGISKNLDRNHRGNDRNRRPRRIIDSMCGRYTLTCTSEELASIFDLVPVGYHEERRFNIAPGQWVIVIRPDRERRRVAGAAQWGLVPSWARDPESGPRPINARAEGLADKPTFRGALRHGRCLIPASGFFEWKKVGKGKQAFYIHPETGRLFAFAGLHSHWQGADGELETCTIITTTANAVMAPIHDRMPVILPPEAWSLWLDPESSTKQSLELLCPCPPERLSLHPVSSRVGNARNDDPGLIEPVATMAGLLPEEEP